MMNDHAWMQLHEHREGEHRARARRRGGDDNPAGSTRPSLAQWMRLHLAPRLLHRVPMGQTSPAPTAAVITAIPVVRAAGRCTASDTPTAAALAWMRLASGAGTLEAASRSTTVLERDAA